MMKAKFCLFLAAIALLCLPAYSSANLVIDDFGAGGPGSDTVGDGTVSRSTFLSASVNGGGLQFSAIKTRGNPFKLGFALYSVNAVPGTSTFGDLGDVTRGLQFTATSASNSKFRVALFSDDGYYSVARISTGAPQALQFVHDFSNASKILIGVIGKAGPGRSPGHATLGGTFKAIAAVPEPTSLLLVGVALGGMAIRRKRR